MTKTFYKAETFKTDYKTFGGKIFFSDFNRKASLSDIAARIESDRKFDEQCRKNILNRKNKGSANDDNKNESIKSGGIKH